MAYRNDLEALEERHKALAAEVAERTLERDEAARMLEEARTREHERLVRADHAAGGPKRRRQQMIAIAAGVATSIALIVGIAHVAKRPSHARMRAEAIYVQYERFTNQICTCDSVACTDAVFQRMSQWATALSKDAHHDSMQPEREEVERFTALAQRMTDCTRAVSERVLIPNHYESQTGGINGRNNDNDLERAN